MTVKRGTDNLKENSSPFGWSRCLPTASARLCGRKQQRGRVVAQCSRAGEGDGVHDVPASLFERSGHGQHPLREPAPGRTVTPKAPLAPQDSGPEGPHGGVIRPLQPGDSHGGPQGRGEQQDPAATGAAAAVGALAGSWLARFKLSSVQLKRVIGVLLWLIAAKIIWDLI